MGHRDADRRCRLLLNVRPAATFKFTECHTEVVNGIVTKREASAGFRLQHGMVTLHLVKLRMQRPIVARGFLQL